VEEFRAKPSGVDILAAALAGMAPAPRHKLVEFLLACIESNQPTPTAPSGTAAAASSVE
jgi:hypothetical protein